MTLCYFSKGMDDADFTSLLQLVFTNQQRENSFVSLYLQRNVIRSYINLKTISLRRLLFFKKSQVLDFPGGPVAKTPQSQCRGPRFHPWSGNKIPYVSVKRFRMPQQRSKILSIIAKTQRSQINIFFFKSQILTGILCSSENHSFASNFLVLCCSI